LLELPYKEAVEALLKTSVPSHRSRPLEACSRYCGQLIAGVPFHPVVAAAHRAFMDHRPLCLSPDIIWLMICQGVANHINANAEELRPKIVSHQVKITIHVRRDEFVKGSPENPWAEAIEEFTGKVRQHIGSAFDLFQPNFSTTGPVERAAAGIVLLDAMQSYFTYDMDTFCGIPAITLEGTPEDWQAIADRAEQFAFLDLEWWLEPLRAVLRQFVAAAQGNVDRPFWQSLYKYRDESGGPMITGWISTLFPYLTESQTDLTESQTDLTESQTGLAAHRNPYLTLELQRAKDPDGAFDGEHDDIDIDNEHDDIDFDDEHDDIDFDEEDSDDFDELDDDNSDLDQDSDEDYRDERLVGAWLRPKPNRRRDVEDRDADFGWGPCISNLPSGVSRAPFHWDYLDRSFDMEFLGGFLGVSQDKDTLAVKPEIGWAVREAPEET
jgi:hypothetical protein